MVTTNFMPPSHRERQRRALEPTETALAAARSRLADLEDQHATIARAVERLSARADSDIRAAVLIAEAFIGPAVAEARRGVHAAEAARAAKQRELLPRETARDAPVLQAVQQADAARDAATEARRRVFDLEQRQIEANHLLASISVDSNMAAVAGARVALDVLAAELPAARAAFEEARAASAAAYAECDAMTRRTDELRRRVVDDDDPWLVLAEIERLLGATTG